MSITTKIQSLEKYVEQLETRLRSDVPARHAHRPDGFKQMLEIDLRKTRAKLNELKLKG